MKAEDLIDNIKPLVNEVVELVNNNNHAELMGTIVMLGSEIDDGDVDASVKLALIVKASILNSKES